MPVTPNLELRLDAICDFSAEAVENYPGDPLDVAHALLCTAVETMVQAGLDRADIMELISVVVDGDSEVGG